jgi:hypothetical protein
MKRVLHLRAKVARMFGVLLLAIVHGFLLPGKHLSMTRTTSELQMPFEPMEKSISSLQQTRYARRLARNR